MNRKAIKTLLTGASFALLIFTRAVLAADAPTTQPASIPDELNFLLTENEKSYEKLSWMSYHSEQLFTDFRHGGRTFAVTKDVIQKVPFRYFSTDSVNADPSGKTPNQETHFKGVLNADYFAIRKTGKGYDDVSSYEHESISQRSLVSANTESVHSGGDVMAKCGFGADGLRAREYVSKRAVGAQWTVSESSAAGKRYFTARCNVPMPNGNLETLAELVFAADDGFLISSYRDYYPGPVLQRDCSITIGHAGDEQVAVPIALSCTVYTREEPGTQAQKTISNTFDVKLSDFVLKPAVSDDQFTVAALGVSDGKKFFGYSTSGQTERVVWIGGKLLPDISAALKTRDSRKN
jgi:hypothetical protein